MRFVGVVVESRRVVVLRNRYDARGTDSEGLVRVEKQVAKLEQSMPTMIVKTVRNARSTRDLCAPA